MVDWLQVAFGAIVTVCGIYFITLGIRYLDQAKASVDWPTSPGKVLSSSVVWGYSYHAEVVYEFNVNNSTFSGKRIAFGYYDLYPTSYAQLYGSSAVAQEIVNRYPQDKNVTVHYMPNNPKECTLEVGVNWNDYILLSIGLIFLILGLAIVIFFGFVDW
jgi:hypothetical protein